jgi:hypothetical protein
MAGGKDNFIVKLQFRVRGTTELGSCNEAQTSETKCAEVC